MFTFSHWLIYIIYIYVRGIYFRRLKHVFKAFKNVFIENLFKSYLNCVFVCLPLPCMTDDAVVLETVAVTVDSSTSRWLLLLRSTTLFLVLVGLQPIAAV